MRNKKKKTTIGGQALIEGLMMKGPDKVAVSVRKADGSIKSKVDPCPPAGSRYPILKVPCVRGVASFASMMKTGVQNIFYSANEVDDGSYEPDKVDLWIEKKFGKEKGEKAIMAVALVIGIAVPIALFILLPTLLAGVFNSLELPNILRNLIEGAIRIGIFVCFLALVSRYKDMQRVFAYHGAEHKAVACYEAGAPLEVGEVKRFSRKHPRCGTSFLFVVMIISVLVFSVVTWSNPLIRMALRLLLLPVVVGISYEINRLAGRYDNWFTIGLRAPGVWLQRFTTREPDDSMIEVAIDALSRVIPEDEKADEW